MADSYRTDTERIQKLVTQIKADLLKRDQKKNAGQPLGLIEGDIRGGLTTLERELVLFNKLVQQSIDQKTVLPKEAETRKNKYLELLNAQTDLKQQFEQSLTSAPIQKNNINTEGLKVLNKNELYQNQKQLERQQDAQLDVVIDQLGTLKTTGGQINKTVQEQNRLLDQINVDVDQTTKEMMKTNSKLKKFVATSSNWCLGIFITLEILSLVLLSIYL